MATFKERLFLEYPLPEQISIWGSIQPDAQEYLPNLKPVKDVDALIESCVEDLGEDLFVVEYKKATGMRTSLPEDTVGVMSAKLETFNMQGNRLVKVSYDPSTHSALLRYFPATIAYRRHLRLTDLDTLRGDRLRYLQLYCWWKMSKLELTILKTTQFNVDNGSISLDALEKFRDQCKEEYDKLKQDSIMLYYSVN